jgi:methylated-DNA-[protein]-cysteine S-methyltransferase
MQKAIKYTIFETKWGYFGLAGSEYGLWRTCLPGSEPEKIKYQLLKSLLPVNRASRIEEKVSRVEFDKTFFKAAQEQITSYFEGACVDFRNICIVLSSVSDFRRLVLTVCRDIEFGRTVSYSTLAKKAGRPTAARAVGSALAKNPLPLIIPCHRIVRNDGKVGDFSAPGGRDLKERLLKHENCALIY